MSTKNVKSNKVSKHNASKKGFKHSHNLSKGQKNHLTFVKTGCIGGRLPR